MYAATKIYPLPHNVLRWLGSSRDGTIPRLIEMECCEYGSPNVRVSYQTTLWCPCHRDFGVITVHDCRPVSDVHRKKIQRHV